jgi:hypothetical protein
VQRPPRAPTLDAPGAGEAESTATLEAGSDGAVRGPRARRRIPVLAALVALFAVPLAVALVALRSPRWYPLLDLAQTEMRVRDVSGGHLPLIGLPGRIGPFGDQGSHPGPLSFWALWPFYQGFGATAWALEAACSALQLIALGTSLWIARRRGGLTLLLVVAAALAVLCRAYGPTLLAQPWNPYLPVLFWAVFLLAVWSVLCDDLALLPVAVLAGSFCAQTHVSYLGLVGGLAVVVVVVLARRGAAAWREPERRRWLLRWTGVSALAAAVVWFAPVYEELTARYGNLTKIYETFTDPPEEAIGPGRGVRLLLVRLNPFGLLDRDLFAAHDGRVAVGLGLLALAAWVAGVVVAWRLRHRALLHLDAVLAVGLLFGAASTSRIFGYRWYYLSLWAWGIAVLMLVATGWAVVGAVTRNGRWSGSAPATVVRGASVAVLLAALASLSVDATSAENFSDEHSRRMNDLAPDTVAALESGSVPGGGRDGRYVVTWVDPIAVGSQGYGLLIELEREGFHVGALPPHRAGVRPHRVLRPEDATGEVHLAVGGDVETWRARPDAVEVAFLEPRTPAERREYGRLGEEVVDGLRRAGKEELVPRVDDNVITLATNLAVPPHLRELLTRMVTLGLPIAVFVAPATT